MTGTDAAPNQGHPLAQDPSTRYPSAQRVGLTEQLHGRTVADPYRWLEDPADPLTVTWATEPALSRTVALTTDQLCLLAQYTGLDLEAVCTR